MTQPFLFKNERDPSFLPSGGEVAPYGGLPPFQRNSDTSIEAALKMAGKAGSLRRQIYYFLKERAGRGATDEEVQVGLDMPGNTQRPRRCELEQAGLVHDSGLRRKTTAGREAVVWEVRYGA